MCIGSSFNLFDFQIKDFSTITDTAFTQFRLILGDFDFPAIENAHKQLGPMYFISYIFFVFFVLMVSQFTKEFLIIKTFIF